MELDGVFKEIAEEFKLEFVSKVEINPLPLDLGTNSILHPYQREAVARAIRARRWLFNFEMGLGKTPSAIETMRLCGVETAIIVCPAIVRNVWETELNKWWPSHPMVEILETGSQARKSEAPFKIVSYNLLGNIQRSRADAVILDECHYAKEASTARSKEVKRLIEGLAPQDLRLFLTGTPITSEPSDIWNQLNLLFPERFGTQYKFKLRYCGMEPEPYATSGFKFKGLNPLYGEELEQRLKGISSRVTKSEVIHLLPPLTIQAVNVAPNRDFNPREFLENLSRPDVHKNKMDDLLKSAGSQKIESTIELIKEAMEVVPFVAVLTHFRSTAIELDDRLAAEGIKSICITGAVAPGQRHKVIQKLTDLDRGVLCATMHSLGTGINLTQFSHVIMAELDYSPANVSQALARYHRLGGSKPVLIKILCLKGTLDEKITHVLQCKLASIGDIMRLGEIEKGAQRVFAGEDVPEEDFRKQMRFVADSLTEDDYV